jgi:uncharacterized protein YigE (DUF2233 family)
MSNINRKLPLTLICLFIFEVAFGQQIPSQKISGCEFKLDSLQKEYSARLLALTDSFNSLLLLKDSLSSVNKIGNDPGILRGEQRVLRDSFETVNLRHKTNIRDRKTKRADGNNVRRATTPRPTNKKTGDISEAKKIARRITFADKTFDTYTIDYPRVQLKFYWKDQKGNKLISIDNLKKYVESGDQTLLFATNAGMYMEDNSPQGLYVQDAKEYTPVNLEKRESGNFFMQPNGIFLLTPSACRVITSSEYVNYKSKTIYATQSGPMLVTRGQINSNFTKGSPNKYIRSGVGINDHGAVVFAISNTPTNFYDFALLFREVLKCKEALYLDGAISRMYLPALQRFETGGEFGALIGVTDNRRKQ